MARTRDIKPSFFSNEDLGALPMAARLLYIALWQLADREGRLEDRPSRIKAYAFQYDKRGIDIEGLLAALEAKHFVRRYEVEGVRCIWIPTFQRNQHIHPHEATSTLPSPPEAVIATIPGMSLHGETCTDKSLHVETCTDKSLNVALLSEPSFPSLPSLPSLPSSDLEQQQLRPNIFSLYEQAFSGGLNGMLREELLALEQEHPPDCVEHCFKAAALAQPRPRSVLWVKARLEAHRRDGCGGNANGTNRGKSAAGANTSRVAARIRGVGQ